MEKLISIIVPVYNVEKYLNRCVESIVNQTYKNIEIILVDDGSLDNCPKMCDDWAKKDSRIKVIHKQNGGLSDARNFGIDIAKGDYIGFVDSDDYIECEMYEYLLSMIQKDDSDIAMCSFKYVDESESIIPLDNLLVSETISKKIYLERITKVPKGFYVIACNKLYSRDLFHDLRYPVGKLYEDAFVIHRLIDKCMLISISDKQFYNYFQNSRGISYRKIDIRSLDKFQFLYERYLFFIDNGYGYLLNDLRQVIEDTYITVFSELKIHNFVEYKRYQDVKKMIKIMMRNHENEFPLYKKISIISPLMLRIVFAMRNKIRKQ